MSTRQFAAHAAIFCFALALPLLTLRAQSAGEASAPKSEVVLTQLAQPVYPAPARNAHVDGEVELMLVIQQDGKIHSITPVNGHPLLRQAAIDSAQHSQFECRNCAQQLESYRIVYSFVLDPIACGQQSSLARGDGQQAYPQVSQSGSRIQVLDQTFAACSTGENAKRRSLRCLYLWHCMAPAKNG
jgi:hypothetical protein